MLVAGEQRHCGAPSLLQLAVVTGGVGRTVFETASVDLLNSAYILLRVCLLVAIVTSARKKRGRDVVRTGAV